MVAVVVAGRMGNGGDRDASGKPDGRSGDERLGGRDGKAITPVLRSEAEDAKPALLVLNVGGEESKMELPAPRRTDDELCLGGGGGGGSGKGMGNNPPRALGLPSRRSRGYCVVDGK